MKMVELNNLGRADLLKQLAALREQVRDLRFKIHSKEIKDQHQLTKTRKDVARILTLLNQDK